MIGIVLGLAQRNRGRKTSCLKGLRWPFGQRDNSKEWRVPASHINALPAGYCRNLGGGLYRRRAFEQPRGPADHPCQPSATAIEYIDRTMQNADRLGGTFVARSADEARWKLAAAASRIRPRGPVHTVYADLRFYHNEATLSRPRSRSVCCRPPPDGATAAREALFNLAAWSFRADIQRARGAPAEPSGVFLLFSFTFLSWRAGAAPAVCAPSRKPYRKRAKNRRNETILTEPRNDPETHGA